MVTDEDYFLHGADYAFKKTSETPRKKCCETCAFNPTGPTVRPVDVTIAQLTKWSADYDGFICHVEDEHGVHPRCAAWHALHGRDIRS